MFLADGEAAFQDVFHLHMHIIPRFNGDKFEISANWGKPVRSELDRTAKIIRETYQQLWAVQS